MIVIKLGGSLFNVARALVKEIVGLQDEQQLIIVPGGGIFADTVRKVNPSQEAAHWMAVLAMEQYAYYLADGTGAELINKLDIDDKGVFVLLPYHLLREKDELPHTWDVTSDTIAAWVAKKCKARLIKLTDVDGIYLNGKYEKEIYADKLIGQETCVDAELPHFLMKNRMNCEIINGKCPGRLMNALRGRLIGTLIRG